MKEKDYITVVILTPMQSGEGSREGEVVIIFTSLPEILRSRSLH